MKLLGAAIALIGIGCGQASPPAAEPFVVELRAAAGDGSPLEGVALALGDGTASSSDARGRAVLMVSAADGTLVRLRATCPAGYDLEAEIPALRLKRTRSIAAKTEQAIPVEVRCERAVHDVVVVVKAERGTRLPVLIDGKALATTDDQGIAHLLVQRARTQTTLQVGLDTSARGALKPVSPTRTFELNGDAVVIFEQPFALTPQFLPRSSRPHRHIPVRVD
jgi:hypothetical protein